MLLQGRLWKQKLEYPEGTAGSGGESGGAGGDGGGGDDPSEGDDPANPDDGKKYTKEELEAEAAKRAEAIAAERIRRMDKKTKAEIEKATREAERLAKLSEEERLAEEKRMQEEQIAKLKQENAILAMGKETSKQLAEHGIIATDEILDMVIKPDADDTKAAIEAFVAVVDKLADEKIKNMAKKSTPKLPGSKNNSTNSIKKEIEEETDALTRVRKRAANLELYEKGATE